MFLVVCIVVLLILITFLITLVYPFWEKKAPLKDDFVLSEIDDMEFSNPVERGAVLGAHWFGRVQRVDGSFVYIYDPDNSTEIVKYPYSIARHYGSVYPIIWAYQHTGDDRYLDIAEHAVEHVEDMIRKNGDRRYVLNGGRSRLFDNGLALIAYSYLYNATGDEEHLEILKGLANLCVDLLDDRGRFDYIYDPLLPDEFSENLMASGEALLGLALAYKFTEIERYLEGFELSASYHMEHLTSDRNKNMSTAYYSWMSSSFSEGYCLTGDHKYLDAAYSISEWLISRYYGQYFRIQGIPVSQAMAENPELIGSFRDLPSMNSCTYSEGLGDVLHAAIEANDTYQIARYRDVLMNASRFILNLMYDEDEAYNFTQPHLVLGGYRHDLFDKVNKDMQWQSRWIRIDYTQHAIGALFRIMRDISSEDLQNYYESLG
jgi:rhamnogalacturonyl hydrolase YesR